MHPLQRNIFLLPKLKKYLKGKIFAGLSIVELR